jgi:hypothetical protein
MNKLNKPASKMPMYDFSNKKIYCFSDIEGSKPNSVSANQDIRRVTALLNDTKFTMDIKTEAFIFTGDLIDRGADNIKLIQRFLKIKETYPDNFMIIIGNRDLNKIRLIDEYFIEHTDDEQQCWEVTPPHCDTFGKLIKHVTGDFSDTYRFRFDHAKLQAPFMNTHQAGWDKFNVKGAMESIFSTNLRDRVINVEEKTLGRFMHTDGTAVLEFNSHFKDDDNLITQTTQFAAIAVMSMVMGCIWKSESLPDYLQKFNGLYIKLLQNSHIIGAFKANDTKFGMASHAGIPISNNTFTLSDDILELELELVTSEENTTLVKALKKIEHSKNTILQVFHQDNLGKKTMRSKREVVKLMQLSVCMLNSQSPVSHMASLNERGPIALQKLQLSTPNDISNSSSYRGRGGAKVPFIKGSVTFYNIFGHQPTGYVPQISLASDIVRNVCLDISKAESISNGNKKSLALLILNLGATNDKIVGVVSKSGILYEYSKTFKEYASEQLNDKRGFYANIYKGARGYTQLSKHGKISINGKDNVKTFSFSIPGTFLKLMQIPSDMLPPLKQLAKSSGKRLIITGGNIFRFIGFMSLALYARTGHDVMFIVTLPKSYLSDDREIVAARESLIQLYKKLVWNIWTENTINPTFQHLYFIYKDNISMFYNDNDPVNEDASNAYTMFNTDHASKLQIPSATDMYSEVIPPQTYKSMYIDTIGSLAYFDGKNSISEFITRNRTNACLFINTGVDTSQMYSPTKSSKMINEFMTLNKLHVINLHDPVTRSECCYTVANFFDKYYEYFGETVDHMMEIFYSQPGVNNVKVYDILTSLILIMQMNGYIEELQLPIGKDSVQCHGLQEKTNLERMIGFSFIKKYVMSSICNLVYDPTSGTTMVAPSDIIPTDDFVIKVCVFDALQEYYMENHRSGKYRNNHIEKFKSLCENREFVVDQLISDMKISLDIAHENYCSFNEITKCTITGHYYKYFIYPNIVRQTNEPIITQNYYNLVPNTLNKSIRDWDIYNRTRSYVHDKTNATERLRNLAAKRQNYALLLKSLKCTKQMPKCGYSNDNKSIFIPINKVYLAILHNRPSEDKDQLLNVEGLCSIYLSDLYNICELVCLAGKDDILYIMENRLQAALVMFDVATQTGTPYDKKQLLCVQMLKLVFNVDICDDEPEHVYNIRYLAQDGITQLTTAVIPKPAHAIKIDTTFTINFT